MSAPTAIDVGLDEGGRFPRRVWDRVGPSLHPAPRYDSLSDGLDRGLTKAFVLRVLEARCLVRTPLELAAIVHAPVEHVIEALDDLRTEGKAGHDQLRGEHGRNWWWAG